MGSKSGICHAEREFSEIFRKGTDLLEAGRLKEAEEAFEEAIRLSPATPEGYLGLAQVQARLGRQELAILLRARAEQLQGAEEPAPSEGIRDCQLDGTGGVAAPGDEWPGERSDLPAWPSGGAAPDGRADRTRRRGRIVRTERPRSRAFWIVAIAGALCGLAIAGVVMRDPPVGVVGSRLVSRAELWREIHTVVQGIHPAPPRNPMLSEREWETLLVLANPPLQRFVVQDLREREALRQLCRERNRTIGKQALEAALGKLRASSAWQRVAQERGWDTEDWRRLAEVVALEEDLLGSWPDAGMPSEGELKAFFRQNEARFVDQQGRRLPFARVAPYLRKQLSLERRFASLRQALERMAERMPTRFWTSVLADAEVRP